MTRREMLLRLTRVDPYRVLRVGSMASQEEIKKSYRELARQFHPDRETGNEEKFKRINEAYSMVDTPEKRLHHDVMLRLLSEPEPYQAAVFRPRAPTPPTRGMVALSWMLFGCWFAGLFQLVSGVISLIQGEWLAGGLTMGLSVVWIPYLTHTLKDLPQMQKYVIPYLPERVRNRLC